MNVVLGSQSPRRKELLIGLLGEEQVTILPPRNSEEAVFDGLQRDSEIEDRLLHIVHAKLKDVVQQVIQLQPAPASTVADEIVLCADTIVVAGPPESRRVLGKPPAENWMPEVRDWFRNYYSNQQHGVWTGVLLRGNGQTESFVTKTQVRMPALDDDLIDWYLSTEEPVGKAGGYGIQGQAAALVESVQGSLTNVIGLPVLEIAQRLKKFGVQLRQDR